MRLGPNLAPDLTDGSSLRDEEGKGKQVKDSVYYICGQRVTHVHTSLCQTAAGLAGGVGACQVHPPLTQTCTQTHTDVQGHAHTHTHTPTHPEAENRHSGAGCMALPALTMECGHHTAMSLCSVLRAGDLGGLCCVKQEQGRNVG